MKKLGLLIALLVVTMSSANANYWTHTPYSDLNYMGGATQWKSTWNY
jgi:hypothetical protein